MRSNKLLVILIVLYIYIISIAIGDNSIQLNRKLLDNESIFLGNAKDENVASSNIILAIDNSNSMSGTNILNAKNVANSLIHRIRSKDIKVGLVSWNSDIDAKEEPSSNLTEISSIIDNITSHRNTCIGLGIRNALDLLEANEYNTSSKSIILITDGEENCTTNETPCNDAIRAKNLGIPIYVIGIGPSNGKEILKCIARESEGKYYYAPDMASLDKIYNDLNDKIEPSSNKVNITADRLAPMFGLFGQGRAIELNEASTNLTVEKVIAYDELNSSPKLVIRIKTPPISKMDIVLALDSSGSIALNNDDAAVKNALKSSLKSFVNYLREKNIDARISILSWDDGVDFAYGDINNIHPTNASLVNLTKIEPEIDMIVNNYSSEEWEGTDFGVGIGNSLLVLNNNKPLFPDTYRCVVLLAGRSEFIACNQTIKNQMVAGEFPIPIYTLGLYPGLFMKNNLTKIANLTGARYIPSVGTENDLDGKLRTMFKDFVDKALYETPIAHDVIIVESLYPYLVPEIRTINGAAFNSYNKTTNTLVLKLDNGLLPGRTYDISFDMSMYMGLPVDVTQEKTKIEVLVSNEVPESNLSYTWYTNKSFTIDLPENQIAIQSRGTVIKKSPLNFFPISLTAVLISFFARRRFS
jgi:uncharacterized protein YegL